MAKIKEEKTDENQNPESQLASYLKQNKDDHFNFEKDNNYRVPSSSLLLNCQTLNGLTPGAHRFTGVQAGGKSSCALDYMYNFLKLSPSEERRGYFFKCEGRLSDQIKERSGVKFTNNVDEFKNGMCFIYESNIYESIFGLIRELIVNNSQKAKYFFIIDSVDMMLRREDLDRPLESANLVAGGALITSTFLKKVALALNKRGHIAIFINQIRDEIKINQYQITTPRQGKASGGHALEHAASFVYEFLPRFNDDLIREDPANKNSKIIGHRCKIKLVKTDNEKTLVDVSYPIKYGRTGGKSVWREFEVAEMLISWDFVKKSSSWFQVNDALKKEIKELGEEIPDKIQGLDNLREYLESKPKVMDYLYIKFIDVLA